MGVAWGLRTHPFTGAFGSDGTEASAFEQPGAVGVDQSTGEVYVADSAAGTVEKFDSAHEPVLFTGLNPDISGSQLTGFSFATTEPLNEIAVDSSSHDLYVVNHGTQSLRAFQADGEPAIFSAGPGAGTNEIVGFAELCGVAVDANGDIYTSDYFQGARVYAPSGEQLATVSSQTKGCNLAVDSHGSVYVDEYEGAVVKLAASEFPVTPSVLYSPAGTVDANLSTGVAVEPGSDRLFVDERTRVVEFDESGHRIGSVLGASGPGVLTRSEGIALNATAGTVYASDAGGEHRVSVFGPGVVLPTVLTGQASVKAGSATLAGTVNPEGVKLKECVFDYVEASKYEPAATNPYAAGATIACAESPGEIGEGSEPVAVHADVLGLQPGVAYHFRLRASNSEGEEAGEDASFATPPPPAITGEAASNLTASTADLGAEINPGGSELIECEFQYGTSISSEHSLPCTPSLAQIGSGTANVAISTHLTSLSPNTTYHWRITAKNSAGTTTSPDHVFVYSTTEEGLPDGRAYEMVTPIHKNAALIGDIVEGQLPTVAEDGSRVILPTVQCFGEATSCVVHHLEQVGTSYAFERVDQGWMTRELTPSAEQFELNSVQLTNPNTGDALLRLPSHPNGQEDFYLRNPNGSLNDIGPVSSEADAGFVRDLLATSDMSHFIFAKEHPLWPAFDEGQSNAFSLYEYVGAQHASPELVGVSGGAGSDDLLSTCGTFEAGHNSDPSRATVLSADGRIVFFTPAVREPGQCPGSGLNNGDEVPDEGVYARVDGAETVHVSERYDPDCKSGACVGSEAAGAHFQGASLDGSRVFFVSTQQLTDNASEDEVDGSRNAPICEHYAEHNGCNLYEARLVRGGLPGSQVVGLRAVSAGDSSGGGPRVQGVMGVSGDGSRVYFVARGVLSALANNQGEVARDGAENLYVSGEGGAPRFIATLAETGSDEQQWTEHRANVSAGDGRFLLFTSQAPLTRDDLRGVGGASQVFRYDAVTESLVRISVGEGGFNDNGNAGVGDASIASAFNAQEFAAGGAVRSGPSMSADGARAFFMSPIGLTRGALDDVRIGVNRGDGVTPEYAENVYEWAGGHVFLISDGRDANVVPQAACTLPVESISAVCLIGVDKTGANVFFTSADQLVPGDADSQLDFYDARMCTVADPCVRPAPGSAAGCGGEECHGIPNVVPGIPGGGTETLEGLGNVLVPSSRGVVLTRAQKLAKALAVCHKDFPRSRARRVVCERSARRQFGSAHRGKRARRRSRRAAGRGRSGR